MVRASTVCKCGFLPLWVQDPNAPVTYDKSSDVYHLTLSTSLSFAIIFCPFCGGHEESLTQKIPKCKCGILSKWANDPDMPIEHDRRLGEYHLSIPNKGEAIFSYCPSCGGLLLESRRKSLFITPSTSEMAKIRKRLKSATKLDDFVKILGEPDERYELIQSDLDKKKIYGIRDVRQALRYDSLAKTLILTIQELEDGEIVLIFEGKPKTNR